MSITRVALVYQVPSKTDMCAVLDRFKVIVERDRPDIFVSSEFAFGYNPFMAALNRFRGFARTFGTSLLLVPDFERWKTSIVGRIIRDLERLDIVTEQLSSKEQLKLRALTIGFWVYPSGDVFAFFKTRVSSLHIIPNTDGIGVSICSDSDRLKQEQLSDSGVRMLFVPSYSFSVGFETGILERTKRLAATGKLDNEHLPPHFSSPLIVSQIPILRCEAGRYGLVCSGVQNLSSHRGWNIANLKYDHERIILDVVFSDMGACQVQQPSHPSASLTQF